MSTIEERIQKHTIAITKAGTMIKKFELFAAKWKRNMAYHQIAIDNLNKKKAKQENKEIR